MVKHSNQLKVILSITFISLLTLSFTTDASAENNVLDQVVILETKGEYNKEEAARMKERIGRIDFIIINSLATKGLHMKLINFPLTDLPEYEFLKGQTPRGWEGTGKTWDDVPGAGGNPAVARIGYSEPNEFHGTINLELHELAHLIDNKVFGNISHSSQFLAIQKEEQSNFLPTVYFNNKEEYFAEAFSYFYLGGQRSSILKQQAPKTYDFIAKLPAILSGESTIEDTVAPLVTLVGKNPIELTTDETYTELGATAIDEVDGDISSEIKISGEVNTLIPGQYIVNYSATDKAGNNTTITRTINVIEKNIDTTPPVIALRGDAQIELNIDDIYEEYGATAEDNIDGDLTDAIKITGQVDTNAPGKYIVTYSIVDNSGNKTSINREITILKDLIVKASTTPIIAINGENPMKLEMGDVYEEQGASAKDELDGDLTAKVEVTGNINTNKIGQYKIVYTVINNSGNTITEERIVNVVESTGLKDMTSQNNITEDKLIKDKPINKKDEKQVEKKEEETDEVLLVSKPEDIKKKPLKEHKNTEVNEKLDPVDSLNTNGIILPITTSPINLFLLMLVGLFLTLSGSSLLLVRRTV